MASVEYKGLGRRKSSIAKVKLVPGKGSILVNGKKPSEFFPNPLIIQDMEQPLVITNTKDQFDIMIKVNGGGFNGQAGAARLGIARALVEASEDYKVALKKAGLITRDARVKERKKFGLYGARRSPQFTKR